jgi:O-antigen/teichoic acid export membrane protein
LQLAVYVLGVALVLLHIRRVAPEIFPKISLWDRSAVRAILKPSSYFGLISMSTFLSYEVPVLILQRETGPFIVVVFTMMRTIFSMCRQILNAPTQAMGAEITRLFGRQEWPELTAVYTYSERMIFAAIPVVNLGVLVLSPVLLMIWLHRPNLFDLFAYVMMAAISMTLSAKEHKFQFQFSTNTHEQLARIMFFSYVALVIVTVPMVHWLGMLGFLYTWFAVEIFQVVRIIGLNKKLFAHTGQHSLTYVYRLLALSSIGLVVAGVLLSHTYRNLYRWQFVASVSMSAGLTVAAFFLFDMRIIVKKLSGHFARMMRTTKV